MSGEVATSEWRVAVLSVGLVSCFVDFAVLHELHALSHLSEAPNIPIVRKSCAMHPLGYLKASIVR